jgi:hypothetical protein
MYILGGFLALGTFLDSVSNAISLLTPLVAGIGTACIVLVWCLVHLILPSHHLSWVFGIDRMPVKKPGIQPTAFAIGMVLLLWLPSVIKPWQTLPPPSSDKGPQGSIYITNIHQGISEEKHTHLAKELGVTQSALTSFFKILEQQRVPLEDLDAKLREIATHYKTLLERVRLLNADDPHIAQLRKAAETAINAGHFDQAERILNEASAQDVAAAQELQALTTTRLLSAAATKCLISEITPGFAGSFFQPDDAVAGHASNARCASSR